MTRYGNAEVLALTRRYLELIEGRELSLDEKQAFIAETVEAYERHVNRGFIGYRKSVTEAGQFAALEWSGKGSVLRDLLGREYIDCLGGYGIFSAGVNHPRILRRGRRARCSAWRSTARSCWSRGGPPSRGCSRW